MSELVEVQVDFVYTKIPADYVCVYHKLLELLAEYGEDMLKDCKASCKERNTNILDCYNMFNAAVAARELNKTRLAALLISYIKAKLKQMYNVQDSSTDSIITTIDYEGNTRAVVHCGDNPEFYIEQEQEGGE